MPPVPLLTATAPGTWGVEPGGSPLDPPWGSVLDQIAALGFDGSELGPLGYYPTDPERLRDELRRRDLRLAGGFVMEPFHDARTHMRIRQLARRTCAALSASGTGTDPPPTLVLIEALDPERSATAGRSDAARRLDGVTHARMSALVAEIASTAADDFGLEAVFHPHAGTYVEFADEIERLLDAPGAERIGLCLDTGHARYAGIDPVEQCRAYGERIRHVHLKDVDEATLTSVRRNSSSFEQAVADGVFCALGEGGVDFAAVARALAEHGFGGWAVFEQDRAAGSLGALEQACTSLNHLRALGIARAPEPAADAT